MDLEPLYDDLRDLIAEWGFEEVRIALLNLEDYNDSD